MRDVAIIDDAVLVEGDALDVDTMTEAEQVAEELIRAERLRAAIAGIVSGLETVATNRVAGRADVENRWLADLRQLHGVYDTDTMDRLKDRGSSRAYINRTAEKCEAMEARLFDLLFPTDDRNWGIGPTPDPELSNEAEEAMDAADQAKAKADEAEAAMLQAKDSGQMEEAQSAEGAMRGAEQEEQDQRTAAERLQERLAEAKRRADAMQEVIHDNLVECDWGAEARDAIADACQIGLGVMKGPVLAKRGPKRWVMDEEGRFQLGDATPNAPAAYRVDPWAVFFDNVSRVEDGEGTFERHLYNARQMRRLAERDDVDEDAVRRVLKAGPRVGALPSYMGELHSLSGTTDSINDRYVVWEYTGALDAADVTTLETAMHPDDVGKVFEDDPLVEVQVRLWFCDGEVLSFEFHPLDSGEPLYSVFTIRQAPAGLYGYGIPWIMRSPQSVLNASWRMMLDNGGLSAGPQVLINSEAISPENGRWKIEPNKVWRYDPTKATSNAPPFSAFNVPSNQGAMGAMIGLASDVIDRVTAMPTVAQGDPGAQVTRTFQGLALLMNSANVVFRRIVKRWDDDVTTPMVRRFYGWHMQFNEREDIKGDLNVMARGASVLLVREMQANNLIAIAGSFGDHPVYGEQIKQDEMLRLIFKAHSIPAEEVLRTPRELNEYREKMTSQADPQAQLAQAQIEMAKEEMELRREEMQTKIAIAEMETDSRLKAAQMKYDADMERTAADLNDRDDDRQVKAGVEKVKQDSAERRLAVEVGMAERTGKSAGGSV